MPTKGKIISEVFVITKKPPQPEHISSEKINRCIVNKQPIASTDYSSLNKVKDIVSLKDKVANAEIG